MTVADLTWHDCTQSARGELAVVQRRYRFHTLDIDDCLSDHERPKIEEYPSYLFLVLRRNIIMMRSVLSPQRATIALLEHKRLFIPEKLAPYFNDILDAIERQWTFLDIAKEMSEALQDIHRAWIGYKTNTIIRLLTGFTVITLPLIIVPGLYGMNVSLPYQGHPSVFLSLTGGMVVLTVVLFLYFWRKKWL